ncbi:MAG: metal-dependent hydrolase [Bacteroidota bacterium]
MPTTFAHAVAGAALGAGRPGVKTILLTAVCAVHPDADIVAFAFGIPYEHPLGHRGLTHSLAFAVVVGAAMTALFYRRDSDRLGVFALLTLATASNGLLDMLTDGGLGVGLWLPFVDERLFFPVRPIAVSPLGTGVFSARGLAVIANEAVWVGVPAVVLAAVLYGVRRHRARRRA